MPHSPKLLAAIDELYYLTKSAPPIGRTVFHFTPTSADVYHHRDDEEAEILSNFYVDRFTPDPSAVVEELRAYLAALAEPQMATDADGRWISKEAK